MEDTIQTIATGGYNPALDLRPKLDIQKIIVLPGRMRRDFTGIVRERAESIRKYGLLHPITVMPLTPPDPLRLDYYILVAGECRYRAYLLLGWDEIPYNLRSDLDPLSAKEIELEENLQRENISDLERVEGMAQIHGLKKFLYSKQPEDVKIREGKKWRTQDTADSLGISAGTVEKHLRVAETLRRRPDLKEQIKNLPLSQWGRVLDRKLEVEDIERKHRDGILKTSLDLQMGDATDLIKQVKAGSVDMILTDPPFGIQALEEMEGSDRGSVQSYTALMKPDDNLSSDQVTVLMTKIMPEFFRVLKEGSHLYLFCAIDKYRELVDILVATGFETHSCALIWLKSRPTTVFNGYNYPAIYEPLIFAWKPPRTRRLDHSMNCVLQYPTVSVKDRLHIFQKPRDLLGDLIKNSSKTGDLILDPFAGVASTGMACKDTGRSFIGFEKNTEHFYHGQSMLAAWTPLQVESESPKSKASEKK